MGLTKFIRARNCVIGLVEKAFYLRGMMGQPNANSEAAIDRREAAVEVGFTSGLADAEPMPCCTSTSQKKPAM